MVCLYLQDVKAANKTGPPEPPEENQVTEGSLKSSSEGSITVNQDKKLSEDAALAVHIPPMEYLMGIADLTGELMRMAIHSVGGGSLEQPFQMCHFLQVVHNAFVSYGNKYRELPRKLTVLRQSLMKVENACYTLHIRGSEIPKHMLAEVLSSAGKTSNMDYMGSDQLDDTMDN